MLYLRACMTFDPADFTAAIAALRVTEVGLSGQTCLSTIQYSYFVFNLTRDVTHLLVHPYCMLPSKC